MATALLREPQQSFFVGRVIWTCECGHINDMKSDALTWKVDCMRPGCGASFAWRPMRVPRGQPGRSRAHFQLWLQRQLSRRQRLGQ